MAEPLRPDQPLAGPDLAAVFDALREGIQIIDREWRYLYLNAAAAAHGMRAREALLGRTMMECYPGIHETEVFKVMRAVMNGAEAVAMPNEFVYPDGKRRTFELRIGRCAVGIVVLSIDVTETRVLEAQFRHAQKMEAIGRLAGSVAHDFNNLLSVILSYSSLIASDLTPADPLRADVDAIREAGERAAALTGQLLAFSRQQAIAPRVLDLNTVVRNAENMLRRLLGADIELSVRLAHDLARAKVDSGQIDQVLLNLIVNARDAMPSGGKVTIETGNVVLDETYTRAHFGVAPGPHVMLAVSDTGTGMSTEVQARIFEPFFTTKSAGRGSGLGLSTVFGIVQQSGGNVWVYSEPGGGATFKVYFPAVRESDVPAAAPPAPAKRGGTETVLVVEDQEEVLTVAAQILRRNGYDVLEARNAGEALLLCERETRTVHLLLTDVVMPHMSGRELAERLLTLRPAMRVMFMSGYTEAAAVEHGILASGIAYLQKPIVPDVLARRVREVLDTR